MSVYGDVQQACEKRLESEYEDDSFCGCNTCVVREVLDAARPFFPALVAAESEGEALRPM